MGKTKPDALLGALDLLVLKTLSRAPAHGYGIAAHIEQISEDVLRVEEGSLYPALHRMEQAGWIASEWRVSETNRRARFYSLTPKGRERLEEAAETWSRVTGAVAKVLGYA